VSIACGGAQAWSENERERNREGEKENERDAGKKERKKKEEEECNAQVMEGEKKFIRVDKPGLSCSCCRRRVLI